MHLGNTITRDLHDSEDIMFKKDNFISQLNSGEVSVVSLKLASCNCFRFLTYYKI